MGRSDITRRYRDARDQYAQVGVDTDRALAAMSGISIGMNCWQADDVSGFEGADGITGGGILATGNFPGRARNGDEVRSDFEFASTLIPGRRRLNLHAMYLESGGRRVERDEIEVAHFRRWIDWARDRDVALDFNPTFFSHPRADGGFTLAARDEGIRAFWIEHGRRCRTVSAAMGASQGSPSIDNFWIPDGWKDLPADRLAHREILIESLDRIFETKLDPQHTRDAVESKLFGIGSESYVVGSHEFYLAYALARGVLFTMDAGHYHPTERVSEKISALLPFVEELLLHVSRPVRWDSDHVVLFDDETRAIMHEIERAEAWNRVYLALDFFDASINRIAAWVIGTRSTQKAALYALLEPTQKMRDAEIAGRLAERLALFEEAKTLPFAAVWDMFCETHDVPAGHRWIAEVRRYEGEVLSRRD
ncbi:MAG: L-rhamnose isomerase [Spirochaetales bacterium]|nr:L-rhamnose isomerase [Spirochaetales bacterium]